MPSWVIKLIQSLAVPILEWVAGVVKDIYAAYKEKKEEKQKEEKQKIRASLVRQIELAKEKGDIEEIKRLSIALHLHDSEL